MRTIKKLTLVLSVAALSCASAHGMFRGIGNAVGNVMSQSGRMATNTLDYATQAPSRLARARIQIDTVPPLNGMKKEWHQPIQDKAILSGVGTPAYLSEETDEMKILPYFGE